MAHSKTADYVILGAGVIGLTTALELLDRYPGSEVAIVAKFVPGDRSVEYTSPWAGANWMSVALDNGPEEIRDLVTYHKFASLAKSHPHCGLRKMEVRALYDGNIDEVDVLSPATGKIWYEELVGGVRWLEGKDLQGAQIGYDFDTWQIDTVTYLGWLYQEVLRRGVKVQRQTVLDIKELFALYSSAKTVFNCSGLGSYSLKGVEDKQLYPTRGQILLVENPTPAITRMSVRSPKRVFKDTTYVFPRNPGGGVVLGGCRLDGVWNGEVDHEFALDIIRRCVELEPGLGSVEEVKSRVLMHGVGLRPSRKGGVRLEKEVLDGEKVVIHNYGIGGAGYQASWGLAKHAVDLLEKKSKL